MQKFKFEDKQYKIIKKLGEGTTAKVYLAENKDKRKICVKIVNKNYYETQQGKKLIDNEIQILSKMKHCNVLFYRGTIRQNKEVMILTEYCDGGDLAQYLKINKNITENKSLEIMQEVFSGLDYLHQNNIIHKDLKPQNIFITKNTFILADLGFAVETNNHTLKKMNAGSPLYMPYESLSSLVFSNKSDVFALGVLWYQMLVGKIPWPATSEKELKEKLKKSDGKFIDVKCSKKVQNIIRKCLCFKESERASASEIKKDIKECLDSLAKNKTQRKQLKQEKVFGDITNIQKRQKTSTSIGSFTKPIQKCQPASSQKVNQTLLDLLTRLKGKDYNYLPTSQSQKFLAIITRYIEITQKTKTTKQITQKSHTQTENCITEIKKSNTEEELCQKIMVFVRRLIRLTKTYKEYKSTVSDLQQLYTRIQSFLI